MIRQAILAALLATAPAVPPAGPPAAVTDWIRANAVPVGAEDAPLSAAEAAVVDRLYGSARVLAIGEPTHGAHEPLAQRNRVIRYLVANRGITTVALESGFAQGRRVDAWMQGGPGDAEAIAHDGLTWTFGDLRANVALITWLRAWNADPAHRKVRFLGADISGGDDADSLGGAPLALEDVIAWFAATLPEPSAAMRRTLAGFVPRFTPEGHAGLTPVERDRLAAALAEAATLLPRTRAAAPSPMAYETAAEGLRDATSLAAIFGVWPGKDQANPLPALVAVSTIRDRTMADHVLWALARDGRRGRIVSFAAVGHVAKTPVFDHATFKGLPWPSTYGINMAAALGDRYRVMVMVGGTSTATPAAAKHRNGSLEPALAAGGNASLFDIRGRSGWWRQEQSIGVHWGRPAQLVPATAADGLMLLPRLTCEPATRPIKSECPAS